MNTTKKSSQRKNERDLNEANAVIFAESSIQSLDIIATQAATWERTSYAKATDELYVLLAECLSFYQSKFLDVHNKSKTALRQSLIESIKQKRITSRVQRNTTTLALLVRYVFASDRKRAHGYSYVLSAAISHGINAADLAHWVRNEGGIEEIKRKMVKSAESIERQRAVAEARSHIEQTIERAQATPLATVQLEGFIGQRVVLLARANPDGSVSILGGLDDADASTYNGLLLRMAKQQANELRDGAQHQSEVAGIFSACDATALPLAA